MNFQSIPIDNSWIFPSLFILIAGLIVLLTIKRCQRRKREPKMILENYDWDAKKRAELENNNSGELWKQ